jgi:uncharacterized protein YbaR (Trm112 family)
VKLDSVLLDILVCPDCKGSLTVDHDNDELICNSCGLIYPVRDNIPIMLVDEARREPPPEEPAPTDAAADDGPPEVDSPGPDADATG